MDQQLDVRCVQRLQPAQPLFHLLRYRGHPFRGNVPDHGPAGVAVLRASVHHMEFQVLMRRLILPALAISLLASCEKEITVDLPITDPKVVVEGTIETGEPPFVLLTRTQSYFAPTSV